MFLTGKRQGYFRCAMISAFLMMRVPQKMGSNPMLVLSYSPLSGFCYD